MKCSIVNYKTIKSIPDLRVDAECYLPIHLQTEIILNKIGFKIIKELSKSVINFGAYSLCNFIEFKEAGTPFIVTEDIKNNIIDESNYHYISEQVHKILYKSHCKKGQILLTMAGAYLGQAAVFNSNYEASSNQAIAKITLKDKSVDEYFISTFLNSKIGQLQIERYRTGTGQPNLNLGLIQAIKIPNISSKLQKNIRKIVLEGINCYQASLLNYKKAERKLYTELGLLNWRPQHELSFIKNFSDSTQADRFDAEYYQPKYDQIVSAVEKYKGGFAELGKLVKIKKSVEPGSEAYQESGVPFVRVSNLSKFEISDINQQYISEELYSSLKSHQPKKNEILLSKDATPGIAYQLNEEPQKMIVSGGILRIIINSQILPEYLTLVINSFIVQKQIERDAGGSIINHWRPDQVKGTLIPILKDEKQKAIKEIVEQSFSDRKLSKYLLEIAKRGVDIAVEKSEEEAQKWMDEELEKNN